MTPVLTPEQVAQRWGDNPPVADEPTSAIARPLYTPEEAASLLGIARNTVYAYVRDGYLVGIRLGARTIRIPRWSIEQFQRTGDGGRDLPEEPGDDYRTAERALRDMPLRRALDLLASFDLEQLDWPARDSARAKRAEIETAVVVQELPGMAGIRPSRVPDRAKRRTISTALGAVDIWAWISPSGSAMARPGGPSRSSTQSASTMREAVRKANAEARRLYGKPIRAIGLRLRYRILERDGFACRYCGRKPPEVELHIDHVIAVANGGSTDDANLVTACADCNLGKSDR